MKAINDQIVLIPERRMMAVQVDTYQHKVELSALPDTTIHDVGGNTMALVPWNAESCQILSNMGYDIKNAHPFVFEHHPLLEAEFEPFPHQLATAAFVILHPRCYVLSDPRTGKTGSLILAMDYLSRSRRITGAFCIITTMTTMRNVWADNIQSTLPKVKIIIVHGPNREKLLEEPADFYITNYDSVRPSAPAFAKAEREGRIGGIVIDELTHVGNKSSKRWLAINSIVNKTNMVYAIGITGSPGDSPEAALGMGLMINSKMMPVWTKRAWQDRITYQYGLNSWNRAYRPDAAKQVFDVLQPAIRYNKADIIKMPPVLRQKRDCTMSAEQRKVFSQLMQQGRMLLDSGETITAANGGVLYGKLMQCSLGFIKNDDGVIVDLDHQERTQTIIECIEESTRKAVVFINYKHAIRQRCAEIKYAGITCEYVDGSITGKERDSILHRFQSEHDPKVLICQPVTTSFGVELSAADTMIFDGPITSGGFTYTQALERLSSVRQKADSISVISISASQVEKKAWKELDDGKKLGHNIATLFEDAVRGTR